MAEGENKPIDRWLGLFALVVGVALYLLPKTESVIIGCCVLIWVSLIHPFVKFWWIEDRKWRQFLAVILLTVGVVGLGINIKPEKPQENQARNGSKESSTPPTTKPDNIPAATATAPALPKTDNPVKRSADTHKVGVTNPETVASKTRASDSDNVTEGIWFGINMEASKTVRDEFWALDPKFLDQYRKNGSLNTIDQFPSEYFDTGWDSTFGKVLVCGEGEIISSAMSFIVSEHPYMAVSVVNGASSDHRCAMRAIAFVPHTGGGLVFTDAGASSWPHHQYILDFPVWGDKNAFGLRFHMWSAELKQLNQGYLPPWKSFAIDDANEKIELQIHRKGANWTPLPRLEQCLPKRIILRTGLESEGPWIVREYKLTSNNPRQIGRGDDASQMFIWAFTWQRTGYAEQPNSFAGVDGTLSGFTQDTRR